jgi:hypothetical protein
VITFAGGALAGALTAVAERLILGWTGLSLAVSDAGQGGALLAMFLLVAPLDEAGKLLVVWPLFRARRIRNKATGLLYAVITASAFTVAASVVWLLATRTTAAALRLALAAPAQLFCAGLWGYALGAGKRWRGRWFSLAWLGAMVLHGVYDHIVFGRGPGLLVLTVPMIAAAAILTWSALKDIGVQPPRSRGPSSIRFASPPSLATMREALQRTDKPLILHWILIGALVTIGLMLASLAFAVYLGHRLGIDFAMADEADVRSSGPIMLLAAAVLAAFPISGYLVARASAARSVLEPALAAGLAMALVIAALSITAPLTVVFAIAVAPVAFGLACGGAWFGMEH